MLPYGGDPTVEAAGAVGCPFECCWSSFCFDDDKEDDALLVFYRREERKSVGKSEEKGNDGSDSVIATSTGLM